MTTTKTTYAGPGTRPAAPKGGPYSISQIAAIVGVHDQSIRRCERLGHFNWEVHREIVSQQRWYDGAAVKQMLVHFGVPEYVTGKTPSKADLGQNRPETGQQRAKV